MRWGTFESKNGDIVFFSDRSFSYIRCFDASLRRGGEGEGRDGVGGESAFLHCVDRFSTGCKRVIRRFSPAFVRAPWPSSPAWHFATVFRVHKYLDIFLNNFFWNVLSAFTIYPNTTFPHSLHAVPPSPPHFLLLGGENRDTLVRLEATIYF